MRPFRWPLCSLLFSASLAALLGFSPASSAQSQDPPSSTGKPQTPAPVKKPVHKTRVVKSNDPIIRLGDRPAESPAPQPPPAAPNDAAALSSDPAQRKAEIAALEKEIRERKRKVELLMRLFVTDEKAFLLNPTNPNEDATTREQRRYEQDELHYETAEVARLQGRLDALKSLPDH